MEQENLQQTRIDLAFDGLIVILILFAILLRLIPVQAVHYVNLFGDMVHYDHSARVLIDRHVYSYWGTVPNAQVTPGYPMFLALVYKSAWFFFHSHQGELRTALDVQAVLSGLTVGVLYAIGRSVLSKWWSFVAAFLWAVYPPAIWSSRQILTETLYVFTLYLFVWSFQTAMKRMTRASWLLSGLLLGVAGLVRPTVFPLLAAPLVIAMWRARTKWRSESPARSRSYARRRLRRVWGHFWQGGWRGGFMAYVMGFLLLLLPWWVRNLHVFHRLILTDTDLGNPLLYGTDPNFQNDPNLGIGIPDQTVLALQRIQDSFTHHPLATLQWYTVGKLDYLFATPWYQPFTVATPGWLIGWVHLHLVWVLIGAVGLALGFFRSGFRLLSVLALFLIVVQLPFIPVVRYAFPLLPLFFLGFGLVGQLLSEQTERIRFRATAK